MNKKNFLLGKGERLTEPVKVVSGGAEKIPPYSFYEAKQRLQPMLQDLVTKISDLPDEACPNGNAVATITLNPEYIAKSYYPTELLRSVGLISVGSRKKTVTPDKKSKDRLPEETTTTELFVMGQKASFLKWSNELSMWNDLTPGAKQIVEIEEINFPEPKSKIKNLGKDGNHTVFEVVLHGNQSLSENTFLNSFRQYLNKRGIEINLESRFYAGGLSFLEVEAPDDMADEIAKYSMVRVVRKMPHLRLLKPTFRTGGITGTLSFHDLPAVDKNCKVAIFDGGIPNDHPICQWATPYDTSGCGPADDELMEHGIAVTSAFLFGHIEPGITLPQPFSNVDHYRVLDSEPGSNPYELFEVLNRIDGVLATEQYSFINLSLGPCLPVDDDEIHVWTAVLDEFLSDGKTLATIAVGNDGEGDPSINANRIQVPSDCVNALSIGACDTPDSNWKRAAYSSIGPGRSPGLIKPDLVDFGGTQARPFLTAHPDGVSLLSTGGTSFAAPSVLRLGAGIKAHFGSSLNALAIKTLLIHSSETCSIPKNEVGWGRAARDLESIVLCDDHTMRVVFQGKITASKYMRAPIPLPSGPINGMVTIKATLCFATPVDPHHPSNYTRSGLEVFMRPNKDAKRKVKEGEPEPLHGKTQTFFGKMRKSFQTEEELRNDALKWENCLHAEHRFQGKTLNEPVFDIHYNARKEGYNDTKEQDLSYALIITVEAPKMKNLYDQVVRKYATQLEQLQPVIDIPVRV